MLRTSLLPPSGAPTTGIVRPGVSSPLGATYDGHGVNFAVFSAHADAIDVCIFGEPDGPELMRVRLPETTGHVFHGYVPGLRPGALYGLRAHGAFDPTQGHRFNPAKLLIDPYARALSGRTDPLSPTLKGNDPRDSAPFVQKCLVVAPKLVEPLRQRVPLADTILYELHVKGFTARHPDVPPELRGTYAALGTEPVLRHLRELGVNAVELMPVHAGCDEPAVRARGKTNYWNYSPLAFMAPDARFSSSGDRGGQVEEFRAAVAALHKAGIEVILDVVFNHTCEGGADGPTLSLRGLDQATYYWLNHGNLVDMTGCGNTVDGRFLAVTRLWADALRTWVQEYGVDGFRFDLGVTLGRTTHGFSTRASFFDVLLQDPVISRVKLFSEPWDLGEHGYRLGDFPLGVSEWNGKFRDGVRRFWAGREPSVRELGYRLTGSSDLFVGAARRPQASLNFVTAHDGFTARDLFTYEQKRNEDNGEQNRDGTDANEGWNCGVEGETEDPAIAALRAQQVRNLLATLLVSQGVPMLVAGDEMGRTQRGNNNAYCQDNELSWVDWSLDAGAEELLAFTRRLVDLRKTHPVLRRTRFFLGEPIRGGDRKDVAWVRADGAEMTGPDWATERALGFLLEGDATRTLDARGHPVRADALLIYLNGARTPTEVVLPESEHGAWVRVLDTADVSGGGAVVGRTLSLAPLSVVVLADPRKE